MKTFVLCLLVASAANCNAQNQTTQPQVPTPHAGPAQVPSEPSPQPDALPLVTPTPGSHRVFIEDKVTNRSTTNTGIFGAGHTTSSGSGGDIHTAMYVAAEFAKKCPAVPLTEDPRAANFVLKTQNGSSTLVAPNGDIVFVSPAKTLHNMVKDVCGYIEKH